MARKQIGAADDFYRIRMVHMDEADLPEFEWRDDILWRRPPVQQISEYELYRIEAVALDNEDDVTVLGVFESAADAHEALEGAQEDIEQLTKSEFEDRYFPAEV
jgi:hypothetical protein